MDIDVLDQRLRQLSGAYAQADRSGQRLGNTIAQSSVLAAPAAGAIQRLSQALFAQTAQQGQSIDALETRLRALKAAERGIGLRREEHLQRLASGRQEIASLASDLVQIQKELAQAKRTQVDFAKDRADLVKREAALAAIPTRTGAQNRELTTVRNLKSDLGKEETRNNADVTRLARETIKNVDAQTKAQLVLNQAEVNYRRGVKEQIEQVRQQRQEFKLLGDSTLSTSHAFRDLGSSVARVFTLTGAAMAIRESQTFNQTLLSTNVALSSRMELWRGALEVQGRTGDSLKNLGELMQVLRGQAQLYRKDWTDVLTVASKLSQGLGASSSEIGEMLSASRALKISFRELADSVTNVVDKTSLSVRETTTLVTELRRVLTGFNAPAVGGAIDGPLRHLAALEQAMKARGATEGSALRVLKQFTSMQQKGGQGMGLLNSGGVDFLRDPTRTREVIRNLANFLEPVRNIPIVFEQMAASVGLAADDAQLLIDASKNLGATERALANNRIDLDKRFAEQAAISGQAWGQFGRQLQALLLEGLTPLTRGVVYLNEKLVKLREFLAGVKAATPDWVKGTAAFTATGVALIAMATAATLAARRVWLTVLALRALDTGGVPSAGRGAVPGLPGLPGIPRVGAPGVPGAPAPTWWGRLTAPVRRAASLPGVPRAGVPTPVPWWKFAKPVAGASSIPTIRAAAGVAAGGAARLLAGLIPLLVSALPVIIAVVAAGLVAWGVYKFYKNKDDKQDQLKASIEEEIRNRRQEAYPKIAAKVNDSLRNQDNAVAAAKSVTDEFNNRRIALISAAEKGDTAGIDLLRKTQSLTTSRLRAEQAMESRVTGRASTERISELERGQAALLAATEQLGKIMREVAEAQTRGAVKLQREAEEKEKQAAEKSRVEKAAREAAVSLMPRERIY